MGTEYSMIKKYIKSTKICHYYQANTTQNHHTVLSRVDRFIRTLRDMFRRYFAEGLDSDEWVLFVPSMIKTYNSTKHNSLFFKDGNKRIYYQVYENPKLRRRIKIKDYLAKYKNYSTWTDSLRIETTVYYRAFTSKAKYSKHKSFIGIYPGIIRKKIGNSFEIQLKNSDDKWRDEKKGVATHFTGLLLLFPRDLIPYSHVRGVKKSKSKYNISKLMDENYKKYQKKMSGIKRKDEREWWRILIHMNI